MAGSAQCYMVSVGQVLSVKTLDSIISQGSEEIPAEVDIKMDLEGLFDSMLKYLRKEGIDYVCSASTQNQGNLRALRTAHYRINDEHVVMRHDTRKVPFSPQEDRYAVIVVGGRVDARIAQLKEQFPQLEAFKWELLSIDRYDRLREAFPQYKLPLVQI